MATTLPVMVRGLDAHGHPFEQVARTVDISPSGARLAGLGYVTRPGRPIDLEHKGRSYAFQAVWVGTEKSARFGQVGISVSEPSWRFWKEMLFEYFPDSRSASGVLAGPGFSAAAALSVESDSEAEKRRFSRLDSDIPVRVGAGDSRSWRTGVVRTISLNGCFIQMRDPAPLGSEVELSLEVGDGTHSRGVVRRSMPAIGMGVEFTEMSVANFRRVQSFARGSVPLHGAAESDEARGEPAPRYISTSFRVTDVVATVIQVLCRKGFSVAMKGKP